MLEFKYELNIKGTIMDKYLMLVNKENKFSEEMLDEFEMKTTNVNGSEEEKEVEANTYNAFKSLKEKLLTLGIKATLNDAKRTVEEQQAIKEKKLKEEGEDYVKKYVAEPGQSEHHLGLALDVRLERPNPKDIRGLRGISIIDKAIMYSKMHAILADYGFILRYTKENVNETGFEPERWHIRYVGREHAKAIKESGMSLERYVEKIRGIELENSVIL
jgi:D-alanyl-D-alanine carboxypeptidase